ncbi:MAG: SDR family oxidoreductase [Deltaproteobacteria bacterium]|nr:SDR family oxidoreductase [Deltaproteobacteria bacterium]MBW2535359.1 SDR family oxidoreductase [Deltaproteobacteria bacterium]
MKKHRTTTKRVLVAGASGYLGRYVVRELRARGHYVRALVRTAAKVADLVDHIDEVVEGQITDPATLRHCCDDIDVVFSSVGITKQKEGLTFEDVDYRGNANLLDEARGAGVTKFVYVSVCGGPKLRHLSIVDAHERFVDTLKAAGIGYAVIRPTGFFSDMGAYFDMAARGRVYVFGRGDSRINPIHGADLAVSCADALEGDAREIDVGGPQVLEVKEIAQLALAAHGKPSAITSLPLWLARLAVLLTRLFSRHQAELLAFITTMATTDVVAPATGRHTLAGHYEQLASSRPAAPQERAAAIEHGRRHKRSA